VTRSRCSWWRALRALGLASALVSALLFAASNFVSVDIRLGGFTLETRLAWAVLVPAALGFAGGMVCHRRRDLGVTGEG
jgi:hypothetical protein